MEIWTLIRSKVLEGVIFPLWALEIEMRHKIWNFIRSNVPEGEILPWWALTMRAILYPLESFYWHMSQHAGYQWESDTWLIEGVTYSGESLRWLAKAQGETYRVTRRGETVMLERVTCGE